MDQKPIENNRNNGSLIQTEVGFRNCSKNVIQEATDLSRAWLVGYDKGAFDKS